MSCPFYGKYAGLVIPEIVGQSGNQCAIIVRSFAPCVMETSLGTEPDATKCELLRAAGLLREVYAHYAENGRQLLKEMVAKELLAEFEKQRREKQRGEAAEGI
jgi:predicted lipid-binding transport protein (Tim44 family)